MLPDLRGMASLASQDLDESSGTIPRPPSNALSHPFFGWEGSPTKIDYRKKGTLILTSLLEDLDPFTVLQMVSMWTRAFWFLCQDTCADSLPASVCPRREWAP